MASGLSQAQGEIVGPIVTSEGSKYLLYVPKNLRKDRAAPLMFFTDAGGGGPKIVESMIEGAEVNAWIVACSLDSRNKASLAENHKHSKNCVADISAKLPVDSKRIYFTGSSGGAATAFYNAANHPHAGVLSSVGYLQEGEPAGGDYFITNGATDYNRYTSANAAEALGAKHTVLRYHEAGHGKAPAWLMSEGMFWLNLRYLTGKGRRLDAERLDFEAQVLDWISINKEQAGHRAYHAAWLMKEEFKISSANKARYDAVLSELDSEANQRYVKGLDALDDFARKKLAPFGSGSQHKHTTPALEAAGEKLSEEYAGVPQIEELALKLGQRTTQ
jgi:predicted esterase